MLPFAPRIMLAAFFSACSFSLSPSLGDESPRWFTNDTHVVARLRVPNSYAAYSKYSGKWANHTFPDHVTVTPVAMIAPGQKLAGVGIVRDHNLVAFAIEGKAIRELVALDRQGRWKVQRLKEPTSKRCVPVVSSSLAVYRVGERTYAFSGFTGTWDVVDCSLAARVSDDTATIAAPDRIYVFSSQSGVWAESPVLADAP